MGKQTSLFTHFSNFKAPTGRHPVTHDEVMEKTPCSDEVMEKTSSDEVAKPHNRNAVMGRYTHSSKL